MLSPVEEPLISMKRSLFYRLQQIMIWEINSNENIWCLYLREKKSVPRTNEKVNNFKPTKKWFFNYFFYYFDSDEIIFKSPQANNQQRLCDECKVSLKSIYLYKVNLDFHIETQ